MCCSPSHSTELLPTAIMQVYAYTTSELQVAILKLFVRAECRLPNLFVGTLTRESVTQALDFGVQADQIISFMQQHAHPHVLHKVPVVPEVCLHIFACHLHSDNMSRPPNGVHALGILFWHACLPRDGWEVLCFASAKPK